MFIPNVRILPANTNGRDFVVGDLHGCVKMLHDELANVRFNTTVDRLFSVGDLIDRGPDSLGTLRLLKEPWFYAVKGNHEDMLLCAFNRKKDPFCTYSDFMNNGGQWIEKLNDSQRQELNDLIRVVFDLPHVIVVGEGKGRFNIVHSELARFYKGKIQVAADSDIDAWVKGLPNQCDVSEENLLWDRELFTTPTTVKSLGYLSPTFCGHTILKDVQTRANHIDLDTGAFRKTQGRSGKLTVGEVKTFVNFLSNTQNRRRNVLC